MLQKNTLYHTCVFCTYVVWCELTHLHGHWRHLWHILFKWYAIEGIGDTFIHMSGHFATWSYKCNHIPLWGSFTRSLPYINTVRYYWQKICRTSFVPFRRVSRNSRFTNGLFFSLWGFSDYNFLKTQWAITNFWSVTSSIPKIDNGFIKPASMVSKTFNLTITLTCLLSTTSSDIFLS